MNTTRPLHRSAAASPVSLARATSLALLALAAVAATGCSTRYAFSVDAVHPAAATSPQRSYRLVDARPDARPGDLRFARVAQDVNTALSRHGMYAAPAGTTPELTIEVDFGVSAPVTRQGVRREPFYMELPGSAYGSTQSREIGGSRVTQPHYLGERDVPYVIKTYRKYLRLTARVGDPADTSAAPHQVWSVLVTNDDTSDDLRAYTRLMVAAALDHIGDDLPHERRIVMTRKDGRVTFVEEGAGST